MSLLLFFFNDSTTTEISTLSLHDALPIYALGVAADLGNLRGAGTDQGATVGNQQHLVAVGDLHRAQDRKSTRLNSSHVRISYAVFCLKKKKATAILHGEAR